jgi:hypothetical protein
MADIENIKEIARDAKALAEFCEKYPRRLEDYKKLHEGTDVDKYGMGFNQDDRFKACKEQRIWFDSHMGYFGSSDCHNLLNVKNEGLFWTAFIKYLNSHQEDIFNFISMEFKKELANRVCQIDDEIARLAKLKEIVTSISETE